MRDIIVKDVIGVKIGLVIFSNAMVTVRMIVLDFTSESHWDGYSPELAYEAALKRR